MHLARVHIEQFRNLGSVTLDLGSHFNYLYGANGAGKTAVLEAVFLLARGRSFRTAKVAPMVRRESTRLLVRGETVGGDGRNRHALGLIKGREGDTELRLDGERAARTSDLARHLPVQLLLPEAANLILEGPAPRRGFLDWGLFHVERQFLGVSRRYRRVVQQRNAWLKMQSREGAQIRDGAEDPWMEQLVALSLELSQMRERYVGGLVSPFREVLAHLAPELTVDVRYDWGGLEDADHVRKKLSDSLARDVKFGLTHRGPHRADLIFESSGVAAGDALSRGQAKIVASAAILAQAVLLESLTETKSVFLIDDFGAELDERHWHLFLETLKGLDCQVIATSTDALSVDAGWRGVQCELFHVEQGVIHKSGAHGST